MIFHLKIVTYISNHNLSNNITYTYTPKYKIIINIIMNIKYIHYTVQVIK